MKNKLFRWISSKQNGGGSGSSILGYFTLTVKEEHSRIWTLNQQRPVVTKFPMQILVAGGVASLAKPPNGSYVAIKYVRVLTKKWIYHELYVQFLVKPTCIAV